MKFQIPITLDVYIYTEEQIELKKVDENAISDLNYNDTTEKRDFYSIDMVWRAVEDLDRMTNILTSGHFFTVKHSKPELESMIAESIINSL